MWTQAGAGGSVSASNCQDYGYEENSTRYASDQAHWPSSIYGLRPTPHFTSHGARIAQYEGVLCEITDETKESGELSPLPRRELDGILNNIPSHAYMSDLDAVRAMLVGASPSGDPVARKSGKSKRFVTPANAKNSRKLFAE